MSDIKRFSEKLQERLRLNQEALSQRQQETNEKMARMLERQEASAKS